MPSHDDRGVLFLTAPPELGGRIAEDVRLRFSTTRWTAYIRAVEASALGSAIDEMDVVSDKPVGSKLGFLRRIRRAQYNLAVISWTGHPQYNRMKLAGLLSGAKRCLIYNENLDCFFLDNEERIWLQHIGWRVSAGIGVTPLLLSGAIRLYKWSFGLVIATAWLMGRLMFRRLRLRFTSAHAH